MGHLGPISGLSWGHLVAPRGAFLCDVNEDSAPSSSKGFEVLSKMLSCLFSAKVHFCATSSRIRHLGSYLVATLGLQDGLRRAPIWPQDGLKRASRGTAPQVGPKAAPRLEAYTLTRTHTHTHTYTYTLTHTHLRT